MKSSQQGVYILYMYILDENQEWHDRIPEGLVSEELIIGWSRARRLLRPELSKQDFRDFLKGMYGYNNYQAGAHVGSLWSFIREMMPGDLVIVPQKGSDEFYMAEVGNGPVRYHGSKILDGTAIRRPARWFNHGMPINRRHASELLRKVLSARQRTCLPKHELTTDAKRMLEKIGATVSPIKKNSKMGSSKASPRQPDLEKRQKVERVAQEKTVALFQSQGYKLNDVSKENLGWDLEAKRSRELLKIEVKGLSGTKVLAELTPNEFRAMKSNTSDYRLSIVTRTLSDAKRKISIFSYVESLDEWTDQYGAFLVISKLLGARVNT